MHLDPSDCHLGMSRESNPSGNNDSVPHLGSSSITIHTARGMRGVGTLGDVVSGLGTYRLYILSRKVL
jgi:hypothetical protein